MFALKAKSSKNITGGITITDDGIAFALISHKTSTPTLIQADYQRCDASEQASTLARIAEKNKLNEYPCNIVLSPDEYQLTQVESPEVADSELLSALRWRIKDLIDFHIDDAVIDSLTRPGQASTNKSIDVVAARNSVIQSYVDLMHQAKINIASIDIAELSVRNMTTLFKDESNSSAVLNLWDDYARISLYLDNDLYLSRSSSIGLNTLIHLEDNDDASMSIIDSLGLELQRTFDYYESHSRQAPISALYIVSNAHSPTTLSDLIQQRTGITCHSVKLDDLVEYDADKVHFSPECMLAIGGALRTEHD